MYEYKYLGNHMNMLDVPYAILYKRMFVRNKCFETLNMHTCRDQLVNINLFNNFT